MIVKPKYHDPKTGKTADSKAGLVEKKVAPKAPEKKTKES